MTHIDKYANIKNELPELQKVLLDAIQSEFLEIQSIEKQCEKYHGACEEIEGLSKAHFVVYSKYIKKEDHRYEKFIFLDEKGHEVCNVSGQQMELYGILTHCLNLELSKEYEESISHTA